MSFEIRLKSSTNRTSEVRRAVENFFRWVMDAHPARAARVDVQQGPDPFLLYLEGLEDTEDAATESFFAGALHVFLHAEGVELG
jgi:hypothetical protein